MLHIFTTKIYQSSADKNFINKKFGFKNPFLDGEHHNTTNQNESIFQYDINLEINNTSSM